MSHYKPLYKSRYFTLLCICNTIHLYYLQVYKCVDEKQHQTLGLLGFTKKSPKVQFVPGMLHTFSELHRRNENSCISSAVDSLFCSQHLKSDPVTVLVCSVPPSTWSLLVVPMTRCAVTSLQTSELTDMTRCRCCRHLIGKQ